MKKIARRQFLKQGSATVIGASGLAVTHSRSDKIANNQSGGAQHRGPLTGVDVNNRQLDSREFCLDLYQHNRPSLSFMAATPQAARVWQKQTREKLVQLLGGFQYERAALRPVVLEKRQFNGYTREKIAFQSRPNLSVFGFLLLPSNSSARVPAVICLPGHGRGCEDIVGITETGEQRETKSGYAKDFALQVVENGYAAFAIEQMAFGCRRDEPARKKSLEQSSCQPSAGAALLFGQTMIGWRVWDAMRAVDYLQSRREIDPLRIATMGISGGGTTSLFTAAVDTRIKLAVVSGYFNTFRHSILSLSHCIDNYVPGLLNYLEMYDIAGLIAPRSLFVESGSRDPIFPIEGSKLAVETARAIYEVFRAPEFFSNEIFDGEHFFYGKGAFEFMKRRL